MPEIHYTMPVVTPSDLRAARSRAFALHPSRTAADRLSSRCSRLSAAARRRTAPARQARRRDAVRLRRQQGPEAVVRGGTRAGGRRRHADHRRRRPVESRPRHRRGRREARHARGARRQRRAPVAGRRQRAARRLLGAEVVYVADARGARAEDAGDRRAPARARGASRSRFPLARPRRSARSASCDAVPSC